MSARHPNQRDLFALLAATPASRCRAWTSAAIPREPVGISGLRLAGQSITTVDGVNITVGSGAIGAYIDYGALAEAQVRRRATPRKLRSRAPRSPP
jgi:hypothetical protein